MDIHKAVLQPIAAFV